MFKLKKIMIWLLIILILFLITISCFLFVGKAKPAKDIHWGVVFSQKHSELLGLDWQKNYLAILDDLKVKNLKLVAYWDLIEFQAQEYDFSDLDWQINEAQKRGAKVLLVVGRKEPRWPECHIPDWAKSLSEEKQQKEVLAFIKQIVLRYQDNGTITAWQVENEPFFPFGKCPPPNKEFLKKEVSLVKSLDKKRRPIIVTESGEMPFWFKVARIGDEVGHSIYREVWFVQLHRYITYPLPPVFYGRKAWLIKTIFNKPTICTELQAEPWGKLLLYDSSLEEQAKTMNLEKFKQVIDYAKNTGEDSFYLWGAEWWYWMKTKHNQPAIWNEAKLIFAN